MDENNFEGTIVLEKLAEIGEVDSFFEAIDSDDFERAKLLMKQAQLDEESILLVLKKMAEADGNH